MMQFINAYRNEHGCEPIPEEVMDALKLSPQAYAGLQLKTPTSLQTMVGDDGESELGNFIDATREVMEGFGKTGQIDFDFVETASPYIPPSPNLNTTDIINLPVTGAGLFTVTSSGATANVVSTSRGQLLNFNTGKEMPSAGVRARRGRRRCCRARARGPGGAIRT